MTSPLERLVTTGGALAAEAADASEIAGLRKSGRTRLADARNACLSPESRFDLAYNAAHALCLAALRQQGYRAKHRYIVFQVLPHTLGLGPEVWRVLDKAHQARNLSEYEGHAEVDPILLRDLVAAAETVAATIDALPDFVERP